MLTLILAALTAGTARAGDSRPPGAEIVNLAARRARGPLTTAVNNRGGGAESFPPLGADEITGILRRIYGGTGAAPLPPFVEDLARRLQFHPDPRTYLTVYEEGVRFARADITELGLGLGGGEAHTFAINLVRRRPDPGHARFEILKYGEEFLHRAGLRRGGVTEANLEAIRRDTIADVQDQMAGEVGSLNISRIEALRLARATLTNFYLGLDAAETPEFVPRYAIELAIAHPVRATLARVLNHYELAVKFARSRRATLSLGPALGDLHEFARDLIKRRGVYAGEEIKAIERGYATLTTAPAVASIDDGRESKRAMFYARTAAREQKVPLPGVVVDRFETRRQLEAFLTAPVHQAGLGYAPLELEIAIEGWLNRLGGRAMTERFIKEYQIAFVSYVAQQRERGTMDLYLARHAALALVSDPRRERPVGEELAALGLRVVSWDELLIACAESLGGPVSVNPFR